ncbi:hypothetical protein M433DRAFT_380973 [Acidomyces richmondensis BFW]|nr:MAG: hypothetical protein FE78DRAFT_520701 [Acidomyces sp. 'richmondensis']KYG42943.1 hypothetical protein M433DRAFT_380973 [Acidomyces richmondensis BFW]
MICSYLSVTLAGGRTAPRRTSLRWRQRATYISDRLNNWVMGCRLLQESAASVVIGRGIRSMTGLESAERGVRNIGPILRKSDLTQPKVHGLQYRVTSTRFFHSICNRRPSKRPPDAPLPIADFPGCADHVGTAGSRGRTKDPLFHRECFYSISRGRSRELIGLCAVALYRPVIPSPATGASRGGGVRRTPASGV